MAELNKDYQGSLKTRSTQLFAVYLTTRILFVCLVAPTSFLFWNRKGSLTVI